MSVVLSWLRAETQTNPHSTTSLPARQPDTIEPSVPREHLMLPGARHRPAGHSVLSALCLTSLSLHFCQLLSTAPATPTDLLTFISRHVCI